MKYLLLSTCLGLLLPNGLRAEAVREEGKKFRPDPAEERRILEQAEKRKQSLEMQARKYAEAQAMLRVDADSGDCLAAHNQRGVCLVNAREFNRAVGSVEPDQGFGATADEKRESIKRTRRALLRQMLQGEFLTDALKASGLEAEVVKRAREEEACKWAEAAKAVGESRLRAIYARYRESFAAHESRAYQVLASTDSLWIDSLSKLPRPAARGAQAQNPWVTVPDTSMPREWVEAARSLKKKKDEILVPWKAGFARIRLASSHAYPAISYEQALPTLVGLYPYRDPDSSELEQEAKAYYAAHPAEFRRPDTLDLDVALAPGEDADSTCPRKPPRIRMRNLDLPEQVVQWLARLPMRPDARPSVTAGPDTLRPGATLGPVFLGVGMWTFRVERIRKGAGQVRFEEIRDDLQARLQQRRTEQRFSEVADARLDKNRTLGMAVFEELLNERQAPDEAEVGARMRADSAALAAVLPRGLPPEKIRENIRMFALMNLAQARREKSYETWLKESVTLAKIDPD